MRSCGLLLLVLLAQVFNAPPLSAANLEAVESCPKAQGSVGHDKSGGWVQSYPHPQAAAIRLQLAGQASFEKRQYDESLRLFNAALAADPSYLLPRIGLACIAVRKEQFDVAAQELADLLSTAFVPWHRVAVSDIDLAAVWARSGKTVLASAVKTAARGWGKQVENGVFLLSRVAAPVQLAKEDGPLLFAPSQEIVSWDPHSGRYRQVTSEAGRVVAFVQSEDGKSLLYITAQKVRRESGKVTGFQSVGVHLLHLADMYLISKQLLEFDARFTKVSIRFKKGQAQVAALSPNNEDFAVAVDEQLVPLPKGAFPIEKGLVVSTSKVGETSSREFRTDKTCHFRLATALVKGITTVQVIPSNRSRFYLESRFGLGLNGLPLVEGPAPH